MSVERVIVHLELAGWRASISGVLEGRPIGTRTKILLAFVVFFTSFVIKSLQAVDIAPQTHTSAQVFVGLTEDYDRRAITILNGRGILVPADHKPADTGLLSHAPGYSIYLSAIYLFTGRNYFSVQLIQNAINSITAVLTFLLCGELLNWHIGFIAGLIVAISHHLSYYSNLILPDSLCALPVVAGFLLLRRSEQIYHPGVLLAVLAGVAFGLSAWLRPNSMLIGPFVSIMLLAFRADRRRIAAHCAAIALVPLVIIAPITIRNYVLYNEFVPIQIGVGLNLWEGIGESSGDRFGAVAKDGEVAAQEALIYGNSDYAGWWASPDGIKRDRDRVKKSMAIIVENPGWYAGVMMGRMSEMVKYSAHAPLVYRTGSSGADISRAELVPGRFLSFFRPVARFLQRTTKETLLPMIIIGLVALVVVDRRKALFILAVPLYYLLVQSTMHTEFRYALAMQCFVFVFAAIGWTLVGVAVVQGSRRLIRGIKTKR